MYINPNEEINYLNLYIIIKSYLSSLIYPFVEITVRIKKNNEDIITERINSSIILEMSYFDFQKWAQRRINYDLKYLNESVFYSFSFMSNRYVVEENDLLVIRPIYPWNEKILKEIKSIEIKEILDKEIIKIKEREIKKLKKKYLL